MKSINNQCPVTVSLTLRHLLDFRASVHAQRQPLMVVTGGALHRAYTLKSVFLVMRIRARSVSASEALRNYFREVISAGARRLQMSDIKSAFKLRARLFQSHVPLTA